jgi:hypothetical protein
MKKRCIKCGETPETIQISNRFEVKCSTPCTRIVSHCFLRAEKVWNETMSNKK